MIILIWLGTLVHFMHAAQMIFLLDVCMLIIRLTFYSLTLKPKARHINTFWLRITLERVFEKSFFAEMTELKAQNSYQDRKWASIWLWKILIVEEILRRQHQQSFNNRKSKIENKTSEIGNCCSESDSDQSTTWSLKTNDKNERFQKQKLLFSLLSKDLKFENNFNDDQTTVAKILSKTFKQRAIDFSDSFKFYWNALTKKYRLLTKMLNLSHQKRRNFEAQLFVNDWRSFNSKTLLSRKLSRSRRFNSKQQRFQQKQKKDDRNEQNWWKKDKDKYRFFKIVNNYYSHCCCKKHFSKFTSSSSFASFESLLSLFVVAFIFCCQVIFIEIMIISESGSLRIFSFIEFLKMSISIFFSSIATFFAVKYMMFMFILKFSEALHFDEHNIIKFFERFEELCDEYEIVVKK